MKRTLRRHGADTNQNIFYLVIAVIVLAAAAFGLDQGLRALARADARNVASTLSSQIRGMFSDVGTLPALTVNMIRDADLMPSNMVNRNTSGNPISIRLPNGGVINTISRLNANPRDFQVGYTWSFATARARGICNSLTAGAGDPSEPVAIGPLGLDYSVATAVDSRCTGASFTLLVTYHR